MAKHEHSAAALRKALTGLRGGLEDMPDYQLATVYSGLDPEAQAEVDAKIAHKPVAAVTASKRKESDARST